VIFAGDAAHQVSPFGARGANSGIAGCRQPGWKLKLVLDGGAPERLLDSYDAERIHGADENILNSTRSTDFITPKSNQPHLPRRGAAPGRNGTTSPAASSIPGGCRCPAPMTARR
jgi:3-(3-hydroxy-phenyl)propionate hydroxylase